MSDFLPLDQAPFEIEHEVLDVDGDDAVATRLLEMGMVPGTRVTIVAQAPLGDPLELEIRGYLLSVRRSEARRVRVTAVS